MERSVPMLANFEKRNYNGNERVWTGRYRNLQNLPHWHLESELLSVESGEIIVRKEMRFSCKVEISII